jgi:hypothetical protein
VPRFFYGNVPREIKRSIISAWRGDAVASFESELWLWFFLGVFRQRWRDRKRPRPPARSPQLEARGVAQ